MSSKLLTVGILLLFSLTSKAYATAYNGYIIKLKKGSRLFTTSAFSSVGSVTKIAVTSFGTFGKVETKKGLGLNTLSKFANNPDVEYIEPNYLISLKSEVVPSPDPKDPSFKKQWGLKNDGKNGSIFSSGIAGEDINAINAWSISKGNKDVKIAVIDTGVDYTHPDLKNQILINEAELNGKPGVDDDGNGYIDDIYGYDFANKDGDPQDGHGHGTHCAGVIGASHDGQGVVGVMADVKILPIKFLSDSGSGETIDAISAIDYAIKRGVQIMSNSWGGGEKEQALEDAIKAADKAGIIFVAAAGNDSADNDSVDSFPANYDVPNVISVASITNKGALSSFSNYGIKKVHVAAPGSSILSTYKNGGYTTMSGTSMATPHVSGIAGLILAKEPNLKPFEVKERLINTSVKSSKLSKASLSGGRVDAFRALTNQ